MPAPPETVYLRQMELGPMQNFVYLIGDPETRDCVVVDPAWEIEAILEQIQADGMRLNGVLVTHTHQDHVGGHLFGHDIPGIEELLAKAPAKVYVHAAEREFLRGFGSDLVKVDGGATLDVGRRKITFVHTPGSQYVHLPDPAAGRPPGRHRGLPRPQLWRHRHHHRRREAEQPHDALPLDD